MSKRPLKPNGCLRAAGVCLVALAVVGSCGKEKASDPVAVEPLPDGPDAGSFEIASTEPVDAGTEQPPTVATVRSICSIDDFCWKGPSAQTNHLRAVTQVSPDNIWAVGDTGTVLQFNGASWNAHPQAEPTDLLGLWASETDVWAVGRGAVILHYDGDSWSKEQTPDLPSDTELRAVWADASGRVWVAGSNGLLLEKGATGWLLVPLETSLDLNAVWGRGAQVWVAGNEGTLLQLVDEQWAVQDSGTSRDILTFHGGEESLWFGGRSGEVRSYEVEQERWISMGGDGVRPAGDVNALRVSAQEHVYVAGSAGDIYHWDGEQLCPVEGDAGAPEEPCPGWVASRHAGQELALFGLWTDGGDGAVAVGEYGLAVQWQGPVRTVLNRGAEDNYLSVSGEGTNSIWVGGDRLLHRTDGRFEAVARDSERAVYVVQALPGGSALLAGTGGMSRKLNGADWQTMDVLADAWLRGLASDGQTGWLVGSRGRAWGLLNGSLWTELETPTTSDLLDVWSLAGGATWAVGENGTILRHDGILWADVPSGPDGGLSVELRSVWSSSDDNAWAVGTGGTVLHFDGVRWTQQNEVSAISLNAVWGRSDSDVWAVGSGGTILHFDGAQWTAQQSGTSHALNGVWGSSTELFVVGERETLLVKALN